MSTQKARKNRGGRGSKKNSSFTSPIKRQVHHPDRFTNGMPPERDVKLAYENTSIQGVAATTFQKQYNPNTYIPENSGTLAWAQYVENVAFYDQYRVVSYKCVVELVNLDTTPVNVYIALTNETLSGGLFSDIATNPYARRKLLGSSAGGASRARMTLSKSVVALTGNDGAPYADSFHAVINANPADVQWLMVGGSTLSGTMTAGVAISVHITAQFKLFSMNFSTMQVPPSPTRDAHYELWSKSGNVQFWLDYLHFSRHTRKEDGKCSCRCGQEYKLHGEECGPTTPGKKTVFLLPGAE